MAAGKVTTGEYLRVIRKYVESYLDGGKNKHLISMCKLHSAALRLCENFLGSFTVRCEFRYPKSALV